MTLNKSKSDKGMQIERMSGTLGAEILNVDLTRALQPSEIGALEDAWTQHRVLIFRDQSIDDADHARFARALGQPAVFGRTAEGVAQEVYGASNTDDHGRPLPAGDERARLLTMNWFWHADGCYRAKPNKGVVLRAVEVAAEGGDTLFADMEAAYAALPVALRQRIDGLVCRHSFARMIEHCRMPPVTPEEAEALPSTSHPIVWRHRGGRRSLFLSPPYMERIDDLGDAETRCLIDELTAWATQERFLYRHRWRARDVLVWDNRWTMHKVTPYDMAHHTRIMRGATLLGDEPV